MSENEKSQAVQEFETQGQAKRSGLMVEFIDFLNHNKKWWLLPIIIVMLLLGVLIVVGGGLGPFIYPLL